MRAREKKGEARESEREARAGQLRKKRIVQENRLYGPAEGIPMEDDGKVRIR